MAPGFATWTLDGQSTLPLIEGPDEQDRALGVVFASFTASLFIVAHPDYVRSVRIMPRGPELIELTVDWLLPPGVAERHAEELERLVALGRLVVAQDGRVCELNQQGLRSRRHHARRAHAAGACARRVPRLAAVPAFRVIVRSFGT